MAARTSVSRAMSFSSFKSRGEEALNEKLQATVTKERYGFGAGEGNKTQPNLNFFFNYSNNSNNMASHKHASVYCEEHNWFCSLLTPAV